jgi:hypothetical protein
VAVLVIAGAAFERIGRHQDRRRYEQIGRSVDIGGRTLNIYCSGQGGPSVVFDTFGHMSGYSWGAVQREAAKHTRACWYDRAGYGWSDPAPMPRTFQSVASDLHALLRAADIPPPFVLVGAGDAASHIRVYHGMYTGEVAGVVLANANDVDDPRIEIPESAKGGFAKAFGSWAPRVRQAACGMYPVLARAGVMRLASVFGNPRRTDSVGLTSDQQTELDFLSDNPTAQQASELCAREESMRQVREAGGLGNLPLVVLASAARRRSAHAQSSVADAWNRYQIDEVPPALARLSSRGRVVLVDSDLTESMIVRAILDVIGAVASPEKE